MIRIGIVGFALGALVGVGIAIHDKINDLVAAQTHTADAVSRPLPQLPIRI
jgi:hypothetical protein